MPYLWVRLEVEADPSGNGDDAVVVRDRSRPELVLEWSLIAGDCVHNARSALDHLVWNLVLQNRSVPNRNNGFPVERKPTTAGHMARSKLRGVHPVIVEAIHGLQPWKGGAGAGHWLWVLAQLNNVDKHRLLLELGGWSNQTVRITNPSTGEVRLTSVELKEVKDGKVVLTDRCGTLTIGQSTSTIRFPVRESDDPDWWDGRDQNGVWVSAEIALQRCLEACTFAVARLQRVAQEIASAADAAATD